MHTITLSTLIPLVLPPLLAWRAYSRLRRLFGRQRLGRLRPWIGIAIYAVLLSGLMYVAVPHVERMVWIAIGLSGGAIIGVFAFKQTRFEATKQGLFYTSEVRYGILISAVFVGRLLYRLLQIYWLEPTLPRTFESFASSLLTMAVFGLLAGYYLSFSTGLIRWRKRYFKSRLQRAGRSQ